MTELMKGNCGFPLCMPGLSPPFLLTSLDKQNSFFILPERFCVLLYHAPSSGDFSSAISSSSSSSTSSAGREGGNKRERERMRKGGRRRYWERKRKCNVLSIFPDSWHSLMEEAHLLCRSTPGSQSALARSVAASEASGTPASSPHALSLWQILCWNPHVCNIPKFNF